MNYEIYGSQITAMKKVMADLADMIENNGRTGDGEKFIDHISCRIKADESMREKLRRRNLDITPHNALKELYDAIGIRVICLFVDDVYECVRLIRSLPCCSVVMEKDYIRDAKPNGYRSYHMVLDVTSDDEDVDGQNPGHYFAEIQLRTIAMDTWAALEHELKYKKEVENPELIIAELHRCANDLAACDVSMQTLRRMIRGT